MIEISCSFDDYVFNTGEKYYRCTASYPPNSTDDDYKFFEPPQYDKSSNDVTFVEIRGFCHKIPQGLTDIFPNMKVLGIYNADFKTISKYDIAEYKNIERFICENSEVEFLPRDLFEGFKNLKYIKFFRNKLSTVEPNILDGLDKLEYVNFRSNPNYSKFYSASPIYVSDSTLEQLKNHLFEQFLALDQEVIKFYIECHPDKFEILRIFRERSNEVNTNLRMHELTYEFYYQNKVKDVAEHQEFEEQLQHKIEELEEINAELLDKVKMIKDIELKQKQQVEELMIEIGNEREEKKKLKWNLQKQIDDLAQQLQSFLLIDAK
ncbi:hypothetical protein ACKWTF_015306 [Chironomus riparius]